MRYYDYGPLRFSLLRGLLLTVVVPAGVVLTLAAAHYVFVGAPSYPDAVRRSVEDIGQLYREYPQGALILHALFFLKGFVYRRRYVSHGSTIVTVLAVAAVVWYGAQRLNLWPSDLGPSLSSMTRDIGDDWAPGERSAPPVAPPLRCPTIRSRSMSSGPIVCARSAPPCPRSPGPHPMSTGGGCLSGISAPHRWSTS